MVEKKEEKPRPIIKEDTLTLTSTAIPTFDIEPTPITEFIEEYEGKVPITYTTPPPPPRATEEERAAKIAAYEEVTPPPQITVPKPPPAYVPPTPEITPEETIETAKEYLEEAEKAKEEIVEHYEQQIAEIDPTARYTIDLPEGDPRGKTFSGTGEYLIPLLEEFRERDISESTRAVQVARAGVASATEYALATKVGKAVEVELARPIPFAPWKPTTISGKLLETIARGAKKRVAGLEYPLALEKIMEVEKLAAINPQFAEQVRQVGGKEVMLANMWKSADLNHTRDKLRMKGVSEREMDYALLKRLAENKATAQRMAITFVSTFAFAATAGIGAVIAPAFVIPALEAAAAPMIGTFVGAKGIELGKVFTGEKRPELFAFETGAELLSFALMPLTFEASAELTKSIIDIIKPPKPPVEIKVSELITTEMPELVEVAGRLEIIEPRLIKEPKITEVLFKQKAMLEEPFIDVETVFFKAGEVAPEMKLFTEEVLGKAVFPEKVVTTEMLFEPIGEIEVGIPVKPTAVVSMIERPMEISIADIMYVEAKPAISYKGMIKQIGFEPVKVVGVAERLPEIDILPSDIFTIEPTVKPSIAMKPFEIAIPEVKPMPPTAALTKAALEFVGVKPPEVKPISVPEIMPTLAVPKYDVRLYDAFGLTKAGKLAYPPALDIKPFEMPKIDIKPITPSLIGVKPITKPIQITELGLGVGVKPAELVGVEAKVKPKVDLALDVGLAEVELLKVPAPALAKVKPLEIGLFPPITPPPPRPPRITFFGFPPIIRKRARIPKKKRVKKLTARDFFYTPTLAAAEFLKPIKKKPKKRIYTGLEMRPILVKGKRKTLKGVKFL